MYFKKVFILLCTERFEVSNIITTHTMIILCANLQKEEKRKGTGTHIMLYVRSSLSQHVFKAL